MTFCQPDVRKPDEVIGSCDNRACNELAVFARLERRWMVAARLPAEGRRDPDAWTPARPASAETARRCRPA